MMWTALWGLRVLSILLRLHPSTFRYDETPNDHR